MLWSCPVFQVCGPHLISTCSIGSHIGQTHSRKWKKNKTKKPCIFLLCCPTVYDFDVLFHIFILLLFIVVIPSLSQKCFLFFSLICMLVYWSDLLSSCDFSLCYLFLLVFYLEKTFNICFRMDLVLLNSFSFLLIWEILYISFYSKYNLAG